MTDRGTYRVKVRVLVDREVYVHASDLEDAEEKAMREAVNLTGGREPECDSCVIRRLQMGGQKSNAGHPVTRMYHGCEKTWRSAQESPRLRSRPTNFLMCQRLSLASSLTLYPICYAHQTMSVRGYGPTATRFLIYLVITGPRAVGVTIGLLTHIANMF